MKSVHSQAKIVGTVATVVGAMLMTLLKGPILNIFGIHGSSAQIQHNSGANLQHAIKGSIMITIGCFSCACFMILQVSFYLKKFLITFFFKFLFQFCMNNTS
jgi:hypothetical protein